MILNNNLYTIVRKEQTSTGISYIIRLNAQHFIYKAHFPGEPVTPGVCILQIAQELLSEETKLNLSLKKIKNAKFTAVIAPNNISELIVTFSNIKTVEGEVSCQCTISSKIPNSVYAKLSFTCLKYD